MVSKEAATQATCTVVSSTRGFGSHQDQKCGRYATLACYIHCLFFLFCAPANFGSPTEDSGTHLMRLQLRWFPRGFQELSWCWGFRGSRREVLLRGLVRNLRRRCSTTHSLLPWIFHSRLLSPSRPLESCSWSQELRERESVAQSSLLFRWARIVSVQPSGNIFSSFLHHL